MRAIRPLILLLSLCLLILEGTGLAAPKKKTSARKKTKKASATKIISKKEFEEIVQKFAQDDRLPIASSTMVEKGRGASYYAADKLVDDDLETFWTEGAHSFGRNEWVAFVLPIGTTHVDIVPGAGKEQFQNFNRPKEMFLDVYQVKLKPKDGAYKLKYKQLGRTPFTFEDKPQLVRKKLSVKLPDFSGRDRTIYVGFLFIKKVYKGMFNDTALALIRTAIIYGE